MKHSWALALMGMVLGAGVLAGGAATHVEPVGAGAKVLYEIPTRASARTVLRAVEAHLDQAAGTPTVAIVAHGGGVNAMLRGATDADGVAYAPALRRLARRGVDLSVCEATLRLRGIDRSRVVPEGRIVPSGSGEITRLTEAGYVPLN